MAQQWLDDVAPQMIDFLDLAPLMRDETHHLSGLEIPVKDQVC